MNAQELAVRRVLVVQSSVRHEYQSVVEALGGGFACEYATSVEDALDRLTQEEFDLILSDASTFVPLERAIIAQQATTVLEAVGQCVCVVDREGRFVWSNKNLAGLGEEVKSKVSSCCVELLSSQYEAPVTHASMLRTRHFSLSVSGDRYYEVTAAPIKAARGDIIQLSAIIADVTPARRLQRKINAIDQAGRELMRLDAQQLARLDVAERLALLEEKIIRYTRDLMHFDNFAIYILDKKTNKLELLMNYDLPAESVAVDLYASTEGNGICGYVVATGRSYICPDVKKDPRYLQGIHDARSSLTVPLRLHDQIMGALNVESDLPAAFTEDDRQFAEIFGRYIAIALNTFDLLVTERVTTTGKLASNVQTEISAPLNDIITEASTLMEDYIGHDDLRHRLQSICDHVMKVKQAVRDVTEPQGVLLGGNRVVPTRDEVLAGRKVLIADDEEGIRQTISDVLINYGCEVETARDGEEAVCMLGARSYDLVFSDIRMPGKSGYDVFAAAKERNPKCPVILMTGFGYDPNHSIIRARQEGLHAVLFKPFKVEQLLSEVRSALAGPASR